MVKSREMHSVMPLLLSDAHPKTLCFIDELPKQYQDAQIVLVTSSDKCSWVT